MRVPPWRIGSSGSETQRRRKSATDLDISLCLVSDFHQEFGLGINHVLQDALIYTVLGKGMLGGRHRRL